jgi:formate hydrogenlyase subunit 6/NADH:ubiquinone oxidoreductase subunit I
MARIALRNLFHKPATRRYPFVVREPWATSRGHITIEFDKCILCGACDRHCPANAIKVERAAGSWWIDRFACVNCGECVVVCPVKCLHMDNKRATTVAFADLAGRQEKHVRVVAPKAPAAPAQPKPEAPKDGQANA